MSNCKDTNYTDEERLYYVTLVCDAIASGKTMLMACDERRKIDNRCPKPPLVRQWIMQEPQRFSEIFNHAIRLSYKGILDEMMGIAYDKEGDVLGEDDKGRRIIDHEHVQRSRLKIDTWKFYLTKCAPRLHYKEDMKAQCSELTAKMIEGDIDTDIAKSMMSVLETQAKILRDAELDERIRILEAKYLNAKG